MTETIVVFGGSGFIGTHLVRRLTSLRTASIISVDIKPPKERLPGVEYRTADVRDLGSFTVDGPITRLYNLAAVHTTPGHPDHEYFEANVAGACEVTAFAARTGTVEIVFTSSISVYGPDESIKNEDTPLTPTSAYGRSKRLAEQIHQRWREEQPGRRLVIVRPAVVFGPGENGNFTRLAKLLKRGVFVYPGRRDTVKACIGVDDLIDAIEFARGKGQPFILFNGSYPKRYTLEEIVSTFKADHFPKARSLTVPRQVVTTAARALGAGSAFNLGIHPDRVLKLVRSTDVQPGWLVANGFPFRGGLREALSRWSQDTAGRFT